MIDNEWSGAADDAQSTDAAQTETDQSPVSSRTDRSETTDRRGENGDARHEWGGPAVDAHGPTEPVESPGSGPMGRLAATGIGVGCMLLAAFVFYVFPASSWLLFAGSALGGGIAGYLRGSNTKESALTGGLAGGIVAIPALLAGGLFLYISGSVLIGDASADGVDVGFALVVAVFFLIAAALSVLLAAIGGAIGAMVTDRPAPK